MRLLPALRDELTAWKLQTPRARPEDRVFATSSGGRFSENNVRTRILGASIARANADLEQAGAAPLPERLTPHGLRHTFASLLVALGKDPRYVMDQLGHADPGFTLRLYTHAMRQDDDERERLRGVVEAAEWAEIGRSSPDNVPGPWVGVPGRKAKTVR